MGQTYSFSKGEADNFLLNLERISQEGREVIMEECYDVAKKFPDLDILIQESDCESGIILDVYDTDEENIYTNTFWYDDLNPDEE